MKIVAVVQARIASVRLPGKVLKDLGGKPSIWWCIQAAQDAHSVDEVVLATSLNKENDALEKWAKKNGVKCIRGSEDDVLQRYVDVIDKTKADAVVRITGDCPLADSRVIGEVVSLFKMTGVPYAQNVDPATYPDGLDVECIDSGAIRDACREAVRPNDRDCVTRYISRNRARWPSRTLVCPLPGLHKERWVLDSPEDLVFLQAVFKAFPGRWRPNYLDVLKLLEEKPHLRKLTAMYSRNERMFDGISTEPLGDRTYVRSERALERAERTIPIGCQTFSKSKYVFPAGQTPLFLSHGDGGYCFDVDGNDYVDLVNAILPNVLGYRDPDVDSSIRSQLNSGISYSLATELEADLSERLVKHIPCAEMVKFGKSGSDVTTAAVRVARAFTGRSHVLQHGYHGWHDWTVARTPRSLGVPDNTQRTTWGLFPNQQGYETMLRNVAHACVIIEPDFWAIDKLKELREACTKTGTILIFDEVITGFRWDIGGFQKYCGVTPDLACFGKAMGNGMPISAVVGRRDLMMKCVPPDNVFYSGTMFGETLSIAAAIATIDKMEREPILQHIWATGRDLLEKVSLKIIHAGLVDVINIHGFPCRAMIDFKGRGAITADQVKASFIKHMAANGVLINNSHNISYAHGKPEIRRVLTAYDTTLQAIKKEIESGAIGTQKGMVEAAAAFAR